MERRKWEKENFSEKIGGEKNKEKWREENQGMRPPNLDVLKFSLMTCLILVDSNIALDAQVWYFIWKEFSVVQLVIASQKNRHWGTLH